VRGLEEHDLASRHGPRQRMSQRGEKHSSKDAFGFQSLISSSI